MYSRRKGIASCSQKSPKAIAFEHWPLRNCPRFCRRTRAASRYGGHPSWPRIDLECGAGVALAGLSEPFPVRMRSRSSLMVTSSTWCSELLMPSAHTRSQAAAPGRAPNSQCCRNLQGPPCAGRHHRGGCLGCPSAHGHGRRLGQALTCSLHIGNQGPWKGRSRMCHWWTACAKIRPTVFDPTSGRSDRGSPAANPGSLTETSRHWPTKIFSDPSAEHIGRGPARNLLTRQPVNRAGQNPESLKT